MFLYQHSQKKSTKWTQWFSIVKYWKEKQKTKHICSKIDFLWTKGNKGLPAVCWSSKASWMSYLSADHFVSRFKAPFYSRPIKFWHFHMLVCVCINMLLTGALRTLTHSSLHVIKLGSLQKKVERTAASAPLNFMTEIIAVVHFFFLVMKLCSENLILWRP